MGWVTIGILVLVAAAAYFVWINRPRPALPAEDPTPYTPSVVVDMDDEPPPEIDFDSGIRANQKNPTREER